MGKPAARMGDMTAHGGTIVLGNPTVLIGKMPASCLGDMHVCPLVTGVVPHVGGPVILGSFGVLAGGRPIARMGDMVTCVGPPDTIVLGEFTVLVGDISPSGGGAGSGGPGGGGGGSALAAVAAVVAGAAGAVAKFLSATLGSSAAAASAGAQAATAGGSSSTAQGKPRPGHWVRFQFTDKAGLPVSGVPYSFSGPGMDGLRGALNAGGEVHKQGLGSGNCTVTLLSLTDAKWSAEEAKVGEEVTMSATTKGFEDGDAATLRIFCRDLHGPDLPVTQIDTKVSGGKIESKWKYEEPGAGGEGGKEPEAAAEPAGYSDPQFFFVAEAGGLTEASGLLKIKNWVELELKDEEGTVLADEKYRVVLPTGEIREGKSDAKGRARLDDVPPGKLQVEVPRFPGSSTA